MIILFDEDFYIEALWKTMILNQHIVFLSILTVLETQNYFSKSTNNLVQPKAHIQQVLYGCTLYTVGVGALWRPLVYLATSCIRHHPLLNHLPPFHSLSISSVQTKPHVIHLFLASLARLEEAFDLYAMYPQRQVKLRLKIA